MKNAAEHQRLVNDLLEDLDLEKAAKDYFEYKANDQDATDMIIFMRDKFPALYDRFMSEWGKANEEMLSNWATSQVPDGPED